MKKSLLLLSLAAMLSFGSLTASAQERQQGSCCNFPTEMALTDAQKKQLKDIKISEEKKLMPIDNQLKEKKAHLNTLRTAEKPDMGQINSTVEEIGKLRIEKQKIKEASIQDIRKVLTEEQRLAFDKRGSHFGKGHGHHQHPQQPRGGDGHHQNGGHCNQQKSGNNGNNK